MGAIKSVSCVTICHPANTATRHLRKGKVNTGNNGMLNVAYFHVTWKFANCSL